MFEEILSSLKRNKLRTTLTGFAVAWGIFMLIVLLGAGNGLVHAFQSSSGKRALNSVSVYPGWTTLEYNGLRTGRRVRLNESDLRAMKQNLDTNIIDIYPVSSKSGLKISYGNEYVNATLDGVYPGNIKVNSLEIKEGRFVNDIDINQKRKICVLSTKTVEILFSNSDPIGQFVNAGGFMYRVVGIYKQDDSENSHTLYVPYSTLMTIYDKDGYVDMITLTTKNLTSIEENDAFESNMMSLIGKRRMFDKNDEGALWIWNRFTNYLRTQNLMEVLTNSIWIVGILTLISGIVGVSNIMLITVKERTHEFGIRKALGAKPRQILLMIVTESVVITAIFGYIGMLMGIGATELLNMIIEQQNFEAFQDPTVDIAIAIEATVTLIVAGTLAGFFPAKRAVSIKPIEALRG